MLRVLAKQFMRKLKILLHCRIFYIVLTIILTSAALLITNLENRKSIYNEGNNKFNGYIKKIEVDGNKLKLEFKAKETLIVDYRINSEEEKNFLLNNLKLGDYLTIEGVLEKPYNNTIFNNFNYRKYLSYKNIFWILKATKITKVKDNNKFLYTLKQKIIDYLNKIPNNEYMYALILGDKTYLDDDVYKSYCTNGINHLFAISGLHVTIIIGIFGYILKRIGVFLELRTFIIYLFLGIYLFLTNYSPSILRASVFYFFHSLNPYLKLSSKKILFITYSLLLLLNPYFIYDLGFQFSFLVTGFIILFYKKQKNYFLDLMYISYLASLASFPLVLYYSFEISLITVINNLIFVPFFSFFLMPLILVTFLFPSLMSITNFLFKLLERLSLFISSFDVVLIFGKPSLIIVFLYYFLIVMFLKYKKKTYLGILLVLLTIHYNLNWFNPNALVLVFDVGQGDSILVNYPYNKGTVLIDTGGTTSYNKEKWKERRKKYHPAKGVITYLKSIGIKNIDYLILTHGDYDHAGDAIYLLDNFKVSNVIFPDTKQNNLISEIISYLKRKKIHYYFLKSGDRIKISNYNLNVLAPFKKSENTNDSSLVLQTKIYKRSFLFLGDISKSIEKEIIEKYPTLKADFLKVAHHGSKTSTSRDLIEKVSPKYAFISSGRNNPFNHPSIETINILKVYNVKIFNTQEVGSIKCVLNSESVETFLTSPP